MIAADTPTKIALPFAEGGGRSAIPLASQIGITGGAASLTDGFPPLTRTPPSAGGIPPNGLEVNQILWLLSAAARWAQAGGQTKRDSAFSTAAGGYPNGAVVQSSDNAGWWRSTADNNTSDPDAGGANWVPDFAYGQTAITLASSNVTLTALQGLRPQILLTGTLGANVSLILPATLQQWLVVNATGGAFTITVKTAAGAGVALETGPNLVYGDGVNIQSGLFPYVPKSAFTGANQSLATQGFQKYPGGMIHIWGSLDFADVPSGEPGRQGVVAFSSSGIVFPTACVQVIPSFSVVAPGPNNWQVACTSINTAGFGYQIQEWGAVVNPGTLRWLAIGY